MEPDSIGIESPELAPFIDEILQEGNNLLNSANDPDMEFLFENTREEQFNRNNNPVQSVSESNQSLGIIYESAKPVLQTRGAFRNYDACSMESSDNHSPSYQSASPPFRPTGIEELTPIISSPGSSIDHFASQESSNSPLSRAQAKEYFGPIESSYLDNIIPVKSEIPPDSPPKQILFLQLPTSSPEHSTSSSFNLSAPSATSDKNSTVQAETSSKRPKKVQRSNQHNVIEKRYRHSINDRIDDLRSILTGKEGKMSKSAVLRNAIEEIENLRKRNKQLEDEIVELKKLRSSDDGSPEPMLRFGQVRSDVSRMVFCFFGILFLFVPLTNYFDVPQFFGYPESLKDVSHVIPEVDQTINTVAERANEIVQKWTAIFMFVFFNGAIFVYFMYRGLIQMEPVTSHDSSEYKQFHSSYTLAVRAFESYNLERAQHRINYCLNTLGRFRARSSLQGIGSILWCLILYTSNKLGIKWFVCCLASKIGSDEHRESSSLASKAFSLSAKISFAKYDQEGVSRFALLSYVAQSMLLLQQAGDKIGPTETCEIYIQALVIIRTILPQFLATIFDVRILRRIKALSKKDIDGKLIWVTDPSGMDFLENENLLNLASTFTSKARSMCALERVSSAYRSYLFGLTMNNLFNRCEVDIETIVQQLDLLQNCSRDSHDPLMYWFTSVIQWALIHVDHDYIKKFPLTKQRKKELMATIENTPPELGHINSDPGSCRLGVASFLLYKASISKLSSEDLLSTLELINVRLERACQEFGNACKTDRVTGLQLIASIADLVLSLATQTLPGLEENKGKYMLIAERMRDTSSIIRHVNTFLQPKVTRLGRWESCIATLTYANPVTIFERTSVYGAQKPAIDSNSDSDSDHSQKTTAQRVSAQQEELVRASLPPAFAALRL